MTISSWLNFGRPAHRGRGSAAGWKFLARPYYSQHAVSASPLSTFFIITRFFTEQVNDDDDDDSDDNQATSTVNDQASLSALYLWPYGTVLKCRSLKTASGVTMSKNVECWVVFARETCPGHCLLPICADVLRPLDLVPLTDFTYIYHPGAWGSSTRSSSRTCTFSSPSNCTDCCAVVVWYGMV